MKNETRLLKSYLVKEFAGHEFSIQIKRAANYALSSDMIKIKTDISFEEIRQKLLLVTRHISIYRKGEFASSHGDGPPELLGITDTLVEFIEVETYK